MAKPDEIVYVHKPKEGQFVAGIPARDLTQEDADRLGEARLAHAAATGLYRPVKAPESDPVKPAEAEKKGDGR